MIDWLSELDSRCGDLFAFAANTLARSTPIYLLLLLTVLTLSRRRVLAASAICHACILGLILLPFATAFTPRFEILSVPSFLTTATSPVIQQTPPAASAEPRVPESDPAHVGVAVAAVPASLQPAHQVVVSQLPLSPPTRSQTEIQSGREIADSASAGQVVKSRLSWRSWVVFAYFGGVLLGLWRTLAGLWAVARLRRLSSAITDGEWLHGLNHWKHCLGIRRTVGLMENAHISVPMTAGWLRPMIFLPPEWREYPENQRDAALLHELAHIRRADYAWHLLLRLVAAFYWVQPQSWIAHPAIRRIRERACDRLCVHWMNGSRSYAEALLQMTMALARRRLPAAGLGVVGSTRLGRRLADLERHSGSTQCVATWPVRMIALLLAIAGVLLLGAVHSQPSRAAAGEEADPQAKQINVEPKPVAVAKNNIDTIPSVASISFLAKGTSSTLMLPPVSHSATATTKIIVPARRIKIRTRWSSPSPRSLSRGS